MRFGENETFLHHSLYIDMTPGVMNEHGVDVAVNDVAVQVVVDVRRHHVDVLAPKCVVREISN